MSVELYGLIKCSICDKVCVWLDVYKVKYSFIDYCEYLIVLVVLKVWVKELIWEKLVNCVSYIWCDFSEQQKVVFIEVQWFVLIKEYFVLVKCLVVVKDGVVSVGFIEKKFKELFGG